MMCGVVAIMSQHNKDAQTFLERATAIEPQSVEAWTLLGETCHRAPILDHFLLNKELTVLKLKFKVVFCINK